ncbi:MAG: hypothetical protein IJZ45_01890 [Bacteroidaceae bacterium]|nr:hypothetical protein [Bacteroidaceae bacterium]
MKKIFSLVVLFACAMIANAQSSMLATLNHEGTVSTFYGATALRDAHNAAVHGDVITLSSGSFSSVNITKAITLRGAGIDVSKTEPTVILGDFNIQIADSITQRLTMEGIYHNYTITNQGKLTNAMFLKNRFKIITYASNGNMENANFIHCKIMDNISLSTGSSASCVNCVIEDPISSNSEFQNCVIRFDNQKGNIVKSSTFKNCLLLAKNSTDFANRFLSSCLAYNCLGFFYSGMFLDMPNNSTNKYISDISTVFKSYNGGDFSDTQNFELTDDAQKKYLGMDGIQVGIHGGMLPFSSTPSNPQITKCNVAAKSTADGKLSVDIEVKAAE